MLRCFRSQFSHAVVISFYAHFQNCLGIVLGQLCVSFLEFLERLFKVCKRSIRKV